MKELVKITISKNNFYIINQNKSDKNDGRAAQQ